MPDIKTYTITDHDGRETQVSGTGSESNAIGELAIYHEHDVVARFSRGNWVSMTTSSDSVVSTLAKRRAIADIMGWRDGAA